MQERNKALEAVEGGREIEFNVKDHLTCFVWGMESRATKVKLNSPYSRWTSDPTALECWVIGMSQHTWQDRSFWNLLLHLITIHVEDIGQLPESGFSPPTPWVRLNTAGQPWQQASFLSFFFFFLIFLLFKCILYIKHINNIEYFENKIIHKNLFNFYIHILSYPKNIINGYLILSISKLLSLFPGPIFFLICF